jgi:hypothetical protein
MYGEDPETIVHVCLLILCLPSASSFFLLFSFPAFLFILSFIFYCLFSSLPSFLLLPYPTSPSSSLLFICLRLDFLLLQFIPLLHFILHLFLLKGPDPWEDSRGTNPHNKQRCYVPNRSNHNTLVKRTAACLVVGIQVPLMGLSIFSLTSLHRCAQATLEFWHYPVSSRVEKTVFSAIKFIGSWS